MKGCNKQILLWQKTNTNIMMSLEGPFGKLVSQFWCPNSHLEFQNCGGHIVPLPGGLTLVYQLWLIKLIYILLCFCLIQIRKHPIFLVKLHQALFFNCLNYFLNGCHGGFCSMYFLFASKFETPAKPVN